MKNGEAFSVTLEVQKPHASTNMAALNRHGLKTETVKCIDYQNKKISWQTFENTPAVVDLLGTELVIIYRQMS